MEKETDGVGERGQERLQEHWNSKLWSVQPSLQAESYSERKKESQVLEGNIQKPSGLIPEFQKQILDPTPGGSDSEGQKGGVCSSKPVYILTPFLLPPKQILECFLSNAASPSQLSSLSCCQFWHCCCLEDSSLPSSCSPILAYSVLFAFRD